MRGKNTKRRGASRDVVLVNPEAQQGEARRDGKSGRPDIGMDVSRLPDYYRDHLQYRAWVESPSLIARMLSPPDLTLFNFATPLDRNSLYLVYRCKFLSPTRITSHLTLPSPYHHQRHPLSGRMVFRNRPHKGLLVPLASSRCHLSPLGALHGQRVPGPL